MKFCYICRIIRNKKTVDEINNFKLTRKKDQAYMENNDMLADRFTLLLFREVLLLSLSESTCRELYCLLGVTGVASLAMP